MSGGSPVASAITSWQCPVTSPYARMIRPLSRKSFIAFTPHIRCLRPSPHCLIESVQKLPHSLCIQFRLHLVKAVQQCQLYSFLPVVVILHGASRKALAQHSQEGTVLDPPQETG